MTEVKRYWLPSKPENGFSKDVEVVLAWDYDALQARVAELERETMQRCWDLIDKHIKRGPLQGNGCDETAQRNGMIMATNLIMEAMSVTEPIGRL